MYNYLWIEGERNLQEYCQRRFKETPRFMETIGHVGPVTVYLKYKKKGDYYTPCYLLFMEARQGSGNAVTWGELKIIEKWSYDKIRANKNSILKD
jgi:hypothetical protein